MNKEAFIDTLRRALYGKVSDYELTDHVRYYEDYIRQEMNRGRSEQEVLEELGDPRLIARTILETSGMKAPEVEYTIDEEPADHEEGYCNDSVSARTCHLSVAGDHCCYADFLADQKNFAIIWRYA